MKYNISSNELVQAELTINITTKQVGWQEVNITSRLKMI